MRELISDILKIEKPQVTQVVTLEMDKRQQEAIGKLRQSRDKFMSQVSQAAKIVPSGLNDARAV